jgi:acyl-coenzyme A thioesterase PaaI-like protein
MTTNIMQREPHVTTPDIPAGFERHTRRSPLTDSWEPLYSKRTEKAVIIGLRLAKPHTNGRGLIHGGLIAALADNAMGHSCAHVMGGVSSLVTIGLSVDFVGTAEVGNGSRSRVTSSRPAGRSVSRKA